MLKKLMIKIKNFNLKQWIQISLWLFSFVMLLVFVFVKLAQTQHSKEWGKMGSNLIAAIGIVFFISLFAALFTTVLFKFFAKKRNKEEMINGKNS